MRKLLFLLLALLFTVSFGYCADLETLQIADLAAVSSGRVVSDNTAILLNIWYTGTGARGQAGVSSNSILQLYEDGSLTSLDGHTAAYDTAQELKDYIDGLTAWGASLGRDYAKGVSPSSVYLAVKDAVDAGTNSGASVPVYLDNSDAQSLTCGIAGDTNTINRLKRLEDNHGVQGNHIIEVWDGSTLIFRRTYTKAAIATATPLTVDFASATDGKGLTGTKGNPLVVQIRGDGGTEAKDNSLNYINIIYDQFKF